MKKLSPSDAIWENWTKRLDDAVGRRFDVVCKTELSILDDMRHISTFTAKDGSEQITAAKHLACHGPENWQHRADMKNDIKLPGRTINGIHVTDLYIRIYREVVCKGWVYGENREGIFCKCRSAAIGLGIKTMGCMVMEADDDCGAFEFTKHCETPEEAREFMDHVARVLL